MQKIKPLILLAYFLFAPVFAVMADSGTHSPDGFEPRLSGEIVNLTLQSRGSQYHHPEWLYGDIILYSGETVKNKQLRYNGFRDALVWLHPDTQQHIMLDTDLISGFSLYEQTLDRKMVFDRITPGRQSQGMFAERLFLNSIALYAHRNIEQTGEATQISGNALRPIAILEAKPVYYIRDHEGTYIELNRLNRRSLLAAFPEQRREVRSLLRQHRIGVFNEAELIQAIYVIEQFLSENN